MNQVDESQRMTVDERGNWQYPSAAATGHIEVEFPTLPGNPNQVERLHARDFGAVVSSRLEASLNRQGYLRSGSQQGPAQVFRHYLACAKGSQLMDSDAIGRMESLAKEFEAEPDQRTFFAQRIRPYLSGLSPKRR